MIMDWYRIQCYGNAYGSARKQKGPRRKLIFFNLVFDLIDDAGITDGISYRYFSLFVHAQEESVLCMSHRRVEAPMEIARVIGCAQDDISARKNENIVL